MFCFQVDFQLLAENLGQLERRCKASWDNLKVVAKHETKAVLKSKLTAFLKDCTQRIIILKVVHRRVINRYLLPVLHKYNTCTMISCSSSCRFHSFLLFLGQPSLSVRDIKVTTFCRIVSEFSLEYRTTRERVLTLKRKRAAHRERTKTRGKMITEVTMTFCYSSSSVIDFLKPFAVYEPSSSHHLSPVSSHSCFSDKEVFGCSATAGQPVPCLPGSGGRAWSGGGARKHEELADKWHQSECPARRAATLQSGPQ